MTRVAITDLVPNTQYKVQVRAVSDGQYSEFSESFVFTTAQNTTVPAAPATVTWTVQGDGFFATWTEVTQDISGGVAIIDSYELELTASSVVKTIVVPAQVGQSGNWSLDFQGNIALWGTPQPIISLRVRAVNNKNIKGNWSGSVNAQNPVPANVAGFSGVAGLNTVDLTWTANTDADLDHYDVFVGTSSGFTPTTGNRIFSGNVTHFTYISTTYSAQYFKIRAIDKFGQSSAVDTQAGPYTPTSPFTVDVTAPATPTGLAATITTATSASLATSAAVSWTANSETDLAGYFLRYRVNGTTPWNVVRYDKTTNSAVITNLVPYVNYDFQLAAVDWTENMSSYTGTATGTGATNAAPGTPTAPTVSTNTMMAQVTIPGTLAAGGAMPADVNYYEVYGSTTTAFTPSAANMLGTIPVGPAMIANFDVPAGGGSSGGTQTWFFKIIAVDNGGLKSSASAQTTGTPGLITATNIADATITDAKITDLTVTKLTAGSGLINSFIVKSTLTIGDASTNGIIQSFDYSAGTAGYKLASVGGTASLEINQGSIAAPALRIQSGNNLLPREYADFEFNSGYYTNALTLFSGAATTDIIDFRFNKQSLKWSPSSTFNTVVLGSSNTDYNTILPPGNYIISYYAMIKTGGVAQSIQPIIRYQTAGGNSTVNGTNQAIPANSTWNRYSTTVTIPGTGTGQGQLYFFSVLAGVVYLDGIQVEEQISGSTAPSVWSPPSLTTIDGGIIKTGSITSTAVAQVVKTTPVYDSTGNLLYYDTPVLVNDPNNRPAWSINAAGAATLSNLNVTGNTVMGDPTTTVTTQNVGIFINTTNTSTTIVMNAGDITVNDVGLGITSANLPGGTTIVSITDSTHAVVSAAATATGSIVAANVARLIRYTTQMASANYIQGQQGWIIRSDGMAEFQQVRVQSLDGSAIVVGTLTADAISSGTIDSDIVLSGSFSTTKTPAFMDVNTTSGSANVTTSTGQFFPDDVGCVVQTVNVPAGTMILAYSSPTAVTLDHNATATASGTDMTILRGRTVNINSAGINLTNAAGTVIINLPTDPSTSATFQGAVIADSVVVNDLFQMSGVNNILGSGSKLTISGGTYVPGSAPTVSFYYSGNQFTKSSGAGTKTFSVANDPASKDATGFMYDPTTNHYYYCVNSLGITLQRFWAPGGGGLNYNQDYGIAVYNAFTNGGDDVPRALASDSSNFYFLTKRNTNGNWRFQGVSRTGIFRSTGAVAGDRTSSMAWDETTNSGIIGFPALTIYGGNTYVAKINSNNQIVLIKYTGIGTTTTAFSSVKANIVSGNIKSLEIGKFDMGGTNVYAIVTVDGPNGGRSNYCFFVNTSSFDATSQLFAVAGDANPIGTVWLAATTDTSTGKFQTLTSSGFLYDYTGFARTNGGTSIKASQFWRNDGTSLGHTGPAGLGYEGPVSTYTLRRRANMIVQTTTPIPDTGGTSPNGVGFRIGLDTGTRWRYADPAAGNTLINTSTLLTADSASVSPAGTVGTVSPPVTPSPALPSGSPSQITNGANMSISGNGAIQANTLSFFAVNQVAGFNINGMKYASTSATTDASGLITVTHQLGNTPTFVSITNQGTLHLSFRVTARTATTFTFEAWNTSTAAVVVSTAIGFSWYAAA